MIQPHFQGRYRVKSIRLAERDYAANGWYFVTICTRDRLHYFGEVVTGQMQLSPMGRIAEQFWVEIPAHHDAVWIDTSVVMPNHLHGIVVIDRPPNSDPAL